jgi:hypothetical protein
MKIYALIPDDYISEASVAGFTFETTCALAKNGEGELTLIIKIKGSDGKPVNGTQYIADLNEDKPSS